MKAADIPDEAVLEIVRRHNEGTCTDGAYLPHPDEYHWAFVWDVEKELSDFPPKVVLAKIRSLIKRNLLNGCPCGCRGDLVIPELEAARLGAYQPLELATIAFALQQSETGSE